MKIFRKIAIYFMMLFIIAGSFIGGDVSWTELVITIYGGIFLLMLDEALSFLKEKL